VSLPGDDLLKSSEGDLNAVPTDFVETVGVQQQDATKTGLAALPK
jgi:hypothetical protein